MEILEVFIRNRRKLFMKEILRRIHGVISEGILAGFLAETFKVVLAPISEGIHG